MDNVRCVLCSETKPREVACIYSHYSRKDGTRVDRFACLECVKGRTKAYRSGVSTNVSTKNEYELVSEEYVIPEGW